jgi:hypothetical protein
MATDELLLGIDKYMNGLSNIILDGKTEESHPKFGHLTVVINMMIGDASDEEFELVLLEIEPDYISGAEERNKIREKMSGYFNQISVIGLPTLTIPPGEDLDFQHLDERFKEGLEKMASNVLERIETPQMITVANISMELNATNSEVIIGTILEAANNGTADLTGIGALWMFTTQTVNLCNFNLLHNKV